MIRSRTMVRNKIIHNPSYLMELLPQLKQNFSFPLGVPPFFCVFAPIGPGFPGTSFALFRYPASPGPCPFSEIVFISRSFSGTEFRVLASLVHCLFRCYRGIKSAQLVHFKSSLLGLLGISLSPDFSLKNLVQIHFSC